MGLFRRKKKESFATRECPGGGGFDLGLVGESNYQAALRALAQASGKPRERFEIEVVLRPEPSNQYDPNAIAVHALNGEKVGYLSRAQAAYSGRYLKRFIEKHDALPLCRAVVFGGQHNPPNYGVAIDVGNEAAGSEIRGSL